MVGPAVHLPDVGSFPEESVRAGFHEAVATTVFSERDIDQFVLLTWGDFPGHETLAVSTLESFQGRKFVHGHVADGFITRIYPHAGLPTPVPIAPEEASLAAATPAPSYAAHLAAWDRTPAQVPWSMIDAAIQDADRLHHSRPLHQILAAARIHLARIVDDASPHAIRETSIVQIAAVMATNTAVRDAIICDVREDPILQQGIKQAALHAPEQIAGDVVATAAMFGFANGDMTSQQVQHFLGQAPDTKLGMLIGHSVAVGIPPRSVATLISELQGAQKAQPSGPGAPTSPQHEEVSR
ncbi:hypothetical protein GCM10010401_08260 [Rarobacter faecitabidus]